MPASVTAGELRQLVEGIRYIEKMNANPLSKDEAAGSVEELRRTFGKSLVLLTDKAAGETLAREDLTAHKPGIGIPVAEMGEVLGRKLQVAKQAGEFLMWEDVFE